LKNERNEIIKRVMVRGREEEEEKKKVKKYNPKF
jgi:hypothetical protein